MPSKQRPLSSKDLLERIGLGEAQPNNLLQDEPLSDLLEELDGDLGAVLQERYRQLGVRHVFKPGDLVRWKPGLQNRRLPGYDTPAVVLEVLDTPIHDGEQESGSAYFREPLDLVLGMFWDRGKARGDFVSYYLDSRRFEPWSRD